jgi:hypothetical protein
LTVVIIMVRGLTTKCSPIYKGDKLRALVQGVKKKELGDTKKQIKRKRRGIYD